MTFGMTCTGTDWSMFCSDEKGVDGMETVIQRPDGRVEVRKCIRGSKVTIVFAKDENKEVLKNVTDMIMYAYAERKARET